MKEAEKHVTPRYTYRCSKTSTCSIAHSAKYCDAFNTSTPHAPQYNMKQAAATRGNNDLMLSVT